MSDSRMGKPHLIHQTGKSLSAEALQRSPLDSAGSEIDEAWLQRLIHDSPEVLPVTDIYARAGGSVLSIGREIPVPPGSIDNLLISNSGHVVLVETKLWRNPQARREAVAQILDYAGYVHEWDYEKLDEVYRKTGKGSLYDAVAPDEDQASWVDSVNRLLAAGEMVLLIVGDGIKSRAKALAETVGGRPDMHFRLALVELQLHRLPDDSMLVVPNTLARTEEIERATVRVVYKAGERPEIDVEVPRPDTGGQTGGGSRTTLDAQALIAEMESAGEEGEKAAAAVRKLLRHIDEAKELVVDWKSAGFAVKTPDPVTEGNLLSLIVVNRPNEIYTYWEWIRKQIQQSWEEEAVGDVLGHKLGELMEQYGGTRSHGGKQVNQKLSQLVGSERDFVRDLSEFVADLHQEADKHQE